MVLNDSEFLCFVKAITKLCKSQYTIAIHVLLCWQNNRHRETTICSEWDILLCNRTIHNAWNQNNDDIPCCLVWFLFQFRFGFFPRMTQFFFSSMVFVAKGRGHWRENWTNWFFCHPGVEWKREKCYFFDESGALL